MRYLLLALVALCCGTAVAQECVDYVENQIQVLDSLSLSGTNTYDLAIEGDVAFICTVNILHAIDITHPESLQIISSLPGYNGNSIAVNNGLVCLVSQDDELHFIDVTDPAAMQHVKTIPETDGLQRVSAHGDYFYLAGNHMGIYTVDATDPAAPQLLGNVDSPERVVVVYPQGDLLYAVGYDSDLSVYDISDRTQPHLLNVVSTYYNGGRNILAVDNHLYLVSIRHLSVYDLINPEAPVRRGHFYSQGSLYALAQVDGLLFAGHDPTVQAYSLANPLQPTVEGRLISSLEAWTLVENNGYLFGVATDAVFFSLDVSNPVSTMPLGNANTVGDAQAVEFSSGLGFVANDDEGLWVHDPLDFYPISLTPAAGTVNNLTIDGELAFLTLGETGIQAVDISDPANPIMLDDVMTPGTAVAIDIYHSSNGNFAIVADSNYDLGVYNVTDTSHLFFQGIYYFPGRVYDVAVKDNYAFAAGNDGGLHVMDLTPLPNPAVEVATLNLGGSITQLHLDGHTLYASGGTDLHVLDVTAPGSPGLLDSYTTSGLVVDMDVHGSVLYCAISNLGMEIISTAELTDLQPLATFHALGQPTGVGVNLEHDMVYLSLGENGLDQLPLQCLLSPVGGELQPLKTTHLGSAYPNPFNPSTTISYDLVAETRVLLQIHDLAGRLVRTLIAGEHQTEGTHLVSWDGRDSAGHTAAAGVYLYRLQAGQVDETRRMTLLK